MVYVIQYSASVAQPVYGTRKERCLKSVWLRAPYGKERQFRIASEITAGRGFDSLPGLMVIGSDFKEEANTFHFLYALGNFICLDVVSI